MQKPSHKTQVFFMSISLLLLDEIQRNEQKCDVRKDYLYTGPHQKLMGSVLGQDPSSIKLYWSPLGSFYVIQTKLLYKVYNLQLLTPDLQFELSLIRPHKPLSGTAKEHHCQETALCCLSPWEQ